MPIYNPQILKYEEYQFRIYKYLFLCAKHFIVKFDHCRYGFIFINISIIKDVSNFITLENQCFVN